MQSSFLRGKMNGLLMSIGTNRQKELRTWHGSDLVTAYSSERETELPEKARSGTRFQGERMSNEADSGLEIGREKGLSLGMQISME